MIRAAIAWAALFASLSLSACAPAANVAPGASPPLHTAAAASEPLAASVELVESAPIETTLDHPDIPNASDVWPEMIRGATRSLDIAEFYISNAPGSRLEPVLAAVEDAAGRGVAVRVLVDAVFAKKYPEELARLTGHAGIVVRRFDVGPVMGGILHAKYFVVDGREAYVGSQNFDWRSLTHIQEIGVRIRDAGAAGEIDRVFALDWDLAAGGAAPAAPSPERELTFPVVAAGEAAALTPVFSPRGWEPDPRTWELPRMIGLIDAATRSVDVQVLTYKLKSRDGSAFPELDAALRRAAGRGVAVRLMVSDWGTHKGALEALQALARLPNVKVEVITIPKWSGGEVPFARVSHAKYMVVDGAHAWIGSSNWEGDYFTKTRNVGVIVDGKAFGQRLDGVFEDGWKSPYAAAVDLGAQPEAAGP